MPRANPPGGLCGILQDVKLSIIMSSKYLDLNRRKRTTVLILLSAVMIVLVFVCLFVGSSHMTLAECFDALF